MIDNEIYQLSNGYTEQNYNQFIQMKKQKVNDMKSLLTFGCEVIVKHNDVIPERTLLLQVNKLTDIIKQHITEVANHKTNEEQLKDFNIQLLNENQKIKREIQEYRSKFLQITNINNKLEHEFGLK
ncbi:unnamed protein product [Adineta steineri]|uniref:Uncharacterized protein n=1 Tax=Adineta steineri TaxID=433720 RepID=A0A813YZN1_9BILA|nr:unnamed protein product [Adineta steineri]